MCVISFVATLFKSMKRVEVGSFFRNVAKVDLFPVTFKGLIFVCGIQVLCLQQDDVAYVLLYSFLFLPLLFHFNGKLSYSIPECRDLLKCAGHFWTSERRLLIVSLGCNIDLFLYVFLFPHFLNSNSSRKLYVYTGYCITGILNTRIGKEDGGEGDRK